jgi:hypothetical protein
MERMKRVKDLISNIIGELLEEYHDDYAGKRTKYGKRRVVLQFLDDPFNHFSVMPPFYKAPGDCPDPA